jgi:diguanylate cyclase (GGDEF)-like protein/PAS domain S-box-containing protein
VIERSKLAWPAIALAIFGVAAVLHSGGQLERIEDGVAEARARLLNHERRSDIVIVGIDAQSLEALHEWPWPRRHHARLLQMLRAAEPKSVFIDIDFSSRSTEEDDALLEGALAEWRGTPIYLASIFQARSGADTALTIARPLPRFAQHAQLASVMIEPDFDGFVREMRSSWRIGDSTLQSIFAYETALPPGTPVPIDYSIDDSSFAYVSFIDVVSGRVAPGALRGKTVYVGPTAIELQDMLPVPVYRTLPGIVLQALATESARAGVLTAPAAAPLNAALALWTVGCAALLSRRGWRANVGLVAAGFAALGATTLYLYAVERVVLEVVPFAVVLAATFVAATIRSLDQQTWRALAYALGMQRGDALLKSVVDSSTDCIMCIDERGIVRTANPAVSRLFGRPAAALLDAPLSDLIPGFSSDGIAPLAGSVLERTARTADGRRLAVEITLSKVATEEGLYTAIVRDVSERQAQQRALEYQATHDPLTGLPNRTALMKHLGQLLAKAEPRQRIALLMLDLSRFKEVNDTLGHDVGDVVLREVARRFSTELRGALIGRIGGDEFSVVLSDVAERTAVDDLALRLIACLRAPIDASGVAIEVGVSIGVAIAPDHSRDARELLRHADVAMYVSKRHGTPFEYYDRDADQHTVRRLGMLSELRAAIDNGGIALHYQPQVNLETGAVEGVEALVRWHHPTLGDVGPAEFITLAEATDLIRPLTDWTLRQAVADVARWSKRNLELRVAVNISARVLQDADFPQRIEALLRSSSIRPSQLELEITESAMMLDPDRARAIVKELHALGVLISIDDYGTGFSSLGYLRDLRVHALKLDKSFVVDLEVREQNRVIVESTVQLAHALGLRVVAEGIETEWVRNYLQSIGYDLGQGFWFARPMSADDCCNWVQRLAGSAPVSTRSTKAQRVSS